MLSTSVASLPHLQTLWSCYCTVVAFSFLFLPQGCPNFLLTLTGVTTAAPASGKVAEAVLLPYLLTPSRTIWISLRGAFQHASFLGNSGLLLWSHDDPTRLGYPCSTYFWGCVHNSAVWYPSPLGNQCPCGLCWKLSASLPRHCWNVRSFQPTFITGSQ